MQVRPPYADEAFHASPAIHALSSADLPVVSNASGKQLLSLLHSAPAAPYRLLLCSMVYNERDLLEWVMYHLLIGVDHIVMFVTHTAANSEMP